MTDVSHIVLTQICPTAGAYGASARLLPVYVGTDTQNSPSLGICRGVLDLESPRRVPAERAVSVGRPVCVRFLDTPDR